MSDSLTLYTNPMSRGRIARWILEETGADYETRLVKYDGDMHSPEYLAINPMGKVPAIVHGDKIVTECAAICAYLADTFPEAGLSPKPDERADYYRWLFFAAGPVEAAVANRSLGIDIPEDKKRMVGYGDFDLMRNTLISAVSGRPYICGDRFTAADVYIGSQVGWGLQFGSIPPSPELTAYSERVYARDAFKRASAKDDAAMAEMN
ncbi:glutathione S-transferase family protein [Hyphomonas sp.]|uniref:glutathione S-transferase family protein n=1 Tax=Hyphomonas sp. TaxID=87 RepID=UPI0030F92781